MVSVGYATLSVIPSMQGFQRAVQRGTLGPMDAAGRDAGRRFGGAFARSVATFGGLGAAFGIASFIKDSVELEARYGKTMAQMRVATKAPADELQRLDDLAIKLGKETVFSAVDAADAMLELAKNGIKPATIEAGALESALTLAAAGSIDLESSATAMGNTLNAFQLRGKRAASVAAALAGAANASSASVGSLAEGLQQSSTVAADVGFNVQETTGILAAFANAGIEGSDAGTSLKTMLTRLLPTTKKASKAMEDYGLEFTTANGEFKSALEIANELETGLGSLSDTERAAALNSIFGSDARRAATILTKEGADGLRDYIKATSDQTAAEEMAQANMEGTAGAIERLKGAWETAKLEFGKSIAPVAADFLDYLSENVDDLAPKLVTFGEWFAKDGVDNIKRFKNFVADDLVPVLRDVGDFAGDAAGFVKDLAGAFNDLPKPAKIAGLAALLGGGAAVKIRGGGGGALGTAGKAFGLAKPVPVFVTNKGFGGVDGTGGGKGGAGRLLLGAVTSIAIAGAATVAIQKVSSKIAPEPTANGNFGTPGAVINPTTNKDGGIIDMTGFLGVKDKDGKTPAEKVDELRSKMGLFGDEADLIGAKKISPSLTVPGLKKANDDFAKFIGYQIEAGKPVTPYINTTSIERAIELARTLDASLPGNSNPNAGVDNGAGYMSGGTGTNGRATFDNVTIVAHDYNDFLTQAQRRTQQAGLGGFN